MLISEHFSLKEFNSFGLDIEARYFCEFSSEDELATLLKLPLIREKSRLVIGRGSNLLFINNFPGVVIHSAMGNIRIKEQNEKAVILEVESGVIWDDLVALSVESGWQGIENLSLIPGETGAAAVQNIGAYGVELKDVIRSVRTMDIETAGIRVFSSAECNYDYRDSVFKNDLRDKLIITSIEIELRVQPEYTLTYQHLESEVLKRGEVNLSNIRKTVIEIRESKLPDPKVLGNAGSFFMNPVISHILFLNLIQRFPLIPHFFIADDKVKISAGWLIEYCGWKGKSIGNVGVHDKQALVLINRGGASGTEIAELAQLIQKDVLIKTGIKLIPEVSIIGDYN